MFVYGSKLNEQSLQKTFQGCFRPSFDSFDQAISEEKIFQKLTNEKLELPVTTMFVDGSGRNEQSLQRTCHRCFLSSLGLFGQAVSEENIFLKSANQKQELPMAAMFVNGSGQNEQSLERTCHRCFLPRKLKCEKLTDDRRRTTDAK